MITLGYIKGKSSTIGQNDEDLGGEHDSQGLARERRGKGLGEREKGRGIMTVLLAY